jgi:hypothetical protein
MAEASMKLEATHWRLAGDLDARLELGEGALPR